MTSSGNATDDRRDKVTIYAQGQVALYLLVDIEAQPATVTMFSDPRGGTYQSKRTVQLGAPLDLPEPFGFALDTGRLTAD